MVLPVLLTVASGAFGSNLRSVEPMSRFARCSNSSREPAIVHPLDCCPPYMYLPFEAWRIPFFAATCASEHT